MCIFIVHTQFTNVAVSCMLQTHAVQYLTFPPVSCGHKHHLEMSICHSKVQRHCAFYSMDSGCKYIEIYWMTWPVSCICSLHVWCQIFLRNNQIYIKIPHTARHQIHGLQIFQQKISFFFSTYIKKIIMQMCTFA